MENSLWYEQPAANWNEALPIGNGSLGAMVYGGVEHETLALNADTLWSGSPIKKPAADKSKAFQKAQTLALAGRYPEAQALLEKELCGPFTEAYLPMGNLELQSEQALPSTGYRRALHLDTAVAETAFAVGTARHVRTAFVSAPDQVLVLHYRVTGGETSFRLRLSTPLCGKTTVQGGRLVLHGICPSHVEPPYVEAASPVVYDENRPGIRFVCAAAVHTDGQLVAQADGLLVKNASDTLILLAVQTGFVDFKTPPIAPGATGMAQIPDPMKPPEANRRILYARHLADYQPPESRCQFALSGPHQTALPTDKRLHALAQGYADNGLYELLFRFGRYLLLASSRPGTQPANLQGLWNDQLRAPWSSNYTLNINTEMNYWPVYAANLAECAQPLIKMVQELAETGQKEAKELYGANGFVVHHNTDLWRAAAPVGNHQPGCACYGFWPLGGAWLCRTVWQGYTYTQDAAYLRDVAYPLLRPCAGFLLSMLVENGQGQALLCPATSPENQFLYGGKPVSVSCATAMGQQIAQELFDTCAKAADLAGDAAFAARLRVANAKLLPPQIAADGRIQEWYSPAPETEPHHRHLSHLYALYPGEAITPEKTPALTQACQKSLIARGDDGTGWSLAWKINLWARLRDGEHALRLLQKQLHPVSGDIIHYADADAEGRVCIHPGGTYPNLFCAHPPFQIDGNFGALAGILEMLAQCDGKTLVLLPALPSAWAEGELRGACLQGGAALDVQWAKGRLSRATLYAGVAVRYQVRVQAAVLEVCLQKGERVTIEWNENTLTAAVIKERNNPDERI